MRSGGAAPTRAARAALAVLAAALAGCASGPPPVHAAQAPPLEYRVPFAKSPPTLKGGLESGVWAAAPWTADFVDIQGPSMPAPAFRTRAKMMWDMDFFYVAAVLEEPHLWATLRDHDQIVFHDNDFEVFIDPDGDTRQYYEIEVNQLGTVFDLFLHRTYREGGPADHAWNCAGLRVDTTLKGTLNDAADLDLGWVVQLSIPWKALRPPESAERSSAEAARNATLPAVGETWRINFSRVQWRNNHEPLGPDGARMARTARTPQMAERSEPYAKAANLPEDNWVWSPQWTIDMHLPQFWGRVTFDR